MNAVITHEIEKLSVAERIALIDDLWASVDTAANEPLPLPEHLDILLEQRYQNSLNFPHEATVSLASLAKRNGIDL